MTSTSLAAAESSIQIVPYQDADPDRRQLIDKAISEINIQDTHSIIAFGSQAQSQLRRISQQLLDGVRAKDTGAAGDTLNAMVLEIRGFDLSDLDEAGKERSFFTKILGFLGKQVKPIALAIQKYETVKSQITAIQRDLEKHKTQLLKDIELLDRQWNAANEYYRTLAIYIAAGEELLRQLQEKDLPAAKQKAENSGDPIEAEHYRRLESSFGDLERKVHDLKLTRQVIMQAIPSIGLVQDNDTSLVTKIQSTIENTIPLWEVQMTQALTIANSREAGGAIKDANDLTNELLTKNAETLRQSNAEIRTQIERGIFDIEAVEKANRDLIATIEESIQIAREGRAKRQDAETRLVECEENLKVALLKADEARTV